MLPQQLEYEATIRDALKRRPAPVALTPPTADQGPLAKRKPDRDSFILGATRVRIDHDQVRQRGKSADDEDTKQLADSILAHGLFHPIDVRWIEADDIYEIAAGERRFIALTQILGWTEVPVRVVEATDDQIVWLQLHENIHRKNLDPLDLADAIHRAMSQGMTIDQVAAKLCKSKTWVQKALTTAKNLVEPAKTELNEHPELRNLETVYEVAQVPAEKQRPLLRRIAKDRLGRKEIRALAAEAKQQRHAERKPRGGRPTSAKPYHKTITTKNGARITIQFRKSRVTTKEITAALREALKAVAA
jgi:ParB family chromosome partitioning protein